MLLYFSDFLSLFLFLYLHSIFVGFLLTFNMDVYYIN